LQQSPISHTLGGSRLFLVRLTLLDFIMSEYVRTYRGLEIYPLVYSRIPRGAVGSFDYDAGFDAAVRICRRGTDDTLTASRVFRIPHRAPFSDAGEARRASNGYAERLIDGQVDGQSVRDL
jgi:hypothetical protein